MSNEYKDYMNDLRAQFEINAKAFDTLPEGWVKSFISQMKNELFKELGCYSEDFEVVDAKEKWAALRVCWRWKDREYTYSETEDINYLTEVIEGIIHKYSDISYKTCMVCGKDADSYTRGYIVPICEEHSGL